MPLNATRLVHASNDKGTGDLNCLAHFLVQSIRLNANLSKDAAERLVAAYRRKNRISASRMDNQQIYEEIIGFTPSQVEEELTPILETLFAQDPNYASNEPRLSKLVRFANRFGIKMEAYVVKRPDEQDNEVAQKYSKYTPSKKEIQGDISTLRTGVARLQLEDIVEQIDEIDQSGLSPQAPVLKLVLAENPADRGCNFYFEYPSQDDDFALHNELMKKTRAERVLGAWASKEPSFVESISVLFIMLGGMLAKFLDVCLGAFSKFQGVFDGNSTADQTVPQQTAQNSMHEAAPSSSPKPTSSPNRAGQDSDGSAEIETKEKKEKQDTDPTSLNPAPSSSSSASRTILRGYDRHRTNAFAKSSDSPTRGRSPRPGKSKFIDPIGID